MMDTDCVCPFCKPTLVDLLPRPCRFVIRLPEGTLAAWALVCGRDRKGRAIFQVACQPDFGPCLVRGDRACAERLVFESKRTFNADFRFDAVVLDGTETTFHTPLDAFLNDVDLGEACHLDVDTFPKKTPVCIDRRQKLVEREHLGQQRICDGEVVSTPEAYDIGRIIFVPRYASEVRSIWRETVAYDVSDVRDLMERWAIPPLLDIVRVYERRAGKVAVCDVVAPNGRVVHDVEMTDRELLRKYPAARNLLAQAAKRYLDGYTLPPVFESDRMLARPREESPRQSPRSLFKSSEESKEECS